MRPTHRTVVLVSCRSASRRLTWPVAYLSQLFCTNAAQACGQEIRTDGPDLDAIIQKHVLPFSHEHVQARLTAAIRGMAWSRSWGLGPACWWRIAWKSSWSGLILVHWLAKECNSLQSFVQFRVHSLRLLRASQSHLSQTAAWGLPTKVEAVPQGLSRRVCP